jgi:Holliday junction resolvase RusA-like endonuclease
LPDRPLNPNWRGHWAIKAKAVKGYRRLACALALEAIGRGRKPRWTAASVRAEFVFRDYRRRDPDNLMASLKPVWDGLRDAGVLADDDRLAILPPLIDIGSLPGVAIMVDAVQLRELGEI